MEKEQAKKVEDLARPIKNWLKENGNPYMCVIITDAQIKVTQDLYGTAIEKDDHC